MSNDIDHSVAPPPNGAHGRHPNNPRHRGTEGDTDTSVDDPQTAHKIKFPKFDEASTPYPS